MLKLSDVQFDAVHIKFAATTSTTSHFSSSLSPPRSTWIALARVAAFLSLIRSIKVGQLGVYFFFFVCGRACIPSYSKRRHVPQSQSTLTHRPTYYSIMSSQPTSPSSAAVLDSSQQQQHSSSNGQVSSSPQSRADSAVHVDDPPEKVDPDSSFQSNASERHPKGKRKRTAYVALHAACFQNCNHAVDIS